MSMSEILEGIDKDELSMGWWETSTGVEFGTGVLIKAVAYETKLQAENEALKQQLVEQVAYGISLTRSAERVENSYLYPDDNISLSNSIGILVDIINDRPKNPQLLKQIQADAVREAITQLKAETSSVYWGEIGIDDLEEYANQLEGSD